jgi:hypothetical protein
MQLPYTLRSALKVSIMFLEKRFFDTVHWLQHVSVQAMRPLSWTIVRLILNQLRYYTNEFPPPFIESFPNEVSSFYATLLGLFYGLVLYDRFLKDPIGAVVALGLALLTFGWRWFNFRYWLLEVRPRRIYEVILTMPLIVMIALLNALVFVLLYDTLSRLMSRLHSNPRAIFTTPLDITILQQIGSAFLAFLALTGIWAFIQYHRAPDLRNRSERLTSLIKYSVLIPIVAVFFFVIFPLAPTFIVLILYLIFYRTFYHAIYDFTLPVIRERLQFSMIRIIPQWSRFGGVGDEDLNEEWVCLANHEKRLVDIANWMVKSESGKTYIFPSLTLSAGATVKLHTGSGVDTQTDLYWGSTREIWNNDKDTVYLYDTSGNLIDRYSY